MTSDKMRHLKKKKSGIFARIFMKQWIKIYFSPNRMLTTWRAIARAHSCHAFQRGHLGSSSLINYSYLYIVINKESFLYMETELCITVRLLVPGHFYFYAVSKFTLRENDISVLLL